MVGTPAARRLGTSIFVLVVTIFVTVRLLGIYPWDDRIFDLWAYWTTRFGLDYASAVPGHTGDYLYSPAFAQLIAPLTALPLPLFAATWTAVLAATLYWLAGWRATLIGLFAPVTISLAIGQTDLFLAAAVVLGFRWPAAWVLPIITKLSPGIGILWFAARREWRSLAIALGATAVVIAASAILDPAAWLGWIEMLARLQFPTPDAGVYLPIPLWIRLPLVAAFIWWGARANHRWTLPIAVGFALPTVWINTPTIFVASLPLVDWAADAPAGRWVRAAGRRTAWSGLRLRRRMRLAGQALRRELGGLGAGGAAGQPWLRGR
jgi:hypothetical protein